MRILSRKTDAFYRPTWQDRYVTELHPVSANMTLLSAYFRWCAYMGQIALSVENPHFVLMLLDIFINGFSSHITYRLTVIVPICDALDHFYQFPTSALNIWSW